MRRPTAAHLSVLSAAAILFLFSESKPLAMNDLGIYLAQGREMAASGGFADVDHFTHTVAGTHFLNGTWLAQLLFFRAWQAGGFALMQFLLACLATGTILITAVGALRVSKSLPVAAGCGLMTAALVLGNLGLRPQIFSLPLFATYALLALTVTPGIATIAASAAIVAAWANLHGAFAVAPVLSLLVASGLMWEAVPADAPLREYPRHLLASLSSTPVRLHILTAFVVVAAACVNPYGPKILGYVAQNSSMPASRGLTEWKRTTPADFRGAMLCLALVATALVCWKERRLPARRDLPVLFGFLFLAFSAVRHVAWTGMVLPIAVARLLPARADDPPKRYPAWLVPLFALFWGALLVKMLPFVRVRGLSGDAELAARFDPKTPVALCGWAAEHEVSGNVFNSMEWGSLLAWRAPAAKLFVDIRIWIYPDDLWQEYLDVSNGLDGWDDKLDRRQVRFAILDRRFHAPLLPKMAASPRWEQIYSDDVGLIYRRLPAP